jgi:hypothetical protein
MRTKVLAGCVHFAQQVTSATLETEVRANEDVDRRSMRPVAAGDHGS